jgi:hypothetical protein
MVKPFLRKYKFMWVSCKKEYPLLPIKAATWPDGTSSILLNFRKSHELGVAAMIYTPR